MFYNNSDTEINTRSPPPYLLFTTPLPSLSFSPVMFVHCLTRRHVDLRSRSLLKLSLGERSEVGVEGGVEWVVNFLKLEIEDVIITRSLHL